MILDKFTQMLGMQAQFSQAAFSVGLGILALAVLLCFFGIRLFKVFSALIMFILTGMFFLFVMKKANMGEIVTTFVILGLLFAAITFRWYRLSAFIMGMFIGFSFTAPFVDSFWINFAVGAAFGAAANLFPVMAIMIMTAVWGGFYMTVAGAELFSINLSDYITALSFIFFALTGIAVQYFLRRDLLSLTLKERRMQIFK